ncbi:MAG: alpha/beta hydrolase [Actinomycetota bacterium]|nr:alpha/beta hydrolase [Actinomycetota bacterium]
MAAPMPEVAGVEHRFAEVNGFRMHYAEAGTGDPLILQHGWPQHWYAWRHQIAPLAERYRVIVPDLRGYGWSEAPRSGYEKSQFARDVVALLDELGIEKARYAGHDWGAVVAYRLAIEHPERFERVAALAAPPPWREGPPPPQVMLAFLAYQSLVSAPFAGSFVMRNGLARRMLGAARSAGEFTEEELAIYDDRWKEPARANASVQTYRTWLIKELPSAMRGEFEGKRLNVPTLVLMGRRELLMKMLQPEVYERKGDDVRTEYADCGHWVPEEAPEAVTEHLLDFFA